MRTVWTTNSAGGWKVPEPGWYRATVIKAWEKDKDGNDVKSKAGDPQCKVIWELDDGTQVWDQLTESKAAHNRTTHVLHCLGFEDQEDGVVVEWHDVDLVDRSCFLGLVHEEWQGKTKAKIGRSGFAVRSLEEGPGTEDQLYRSGEQRYQPQRPAPEESEADPFGDVF